jgi:uncharacterized membrane protein YjgN (DUF898 family)
MHVPVITGQPRFASPWGRPRAPEEAMRLEPAQPAMAGLVLKGTLLTLLTLGLYRFWYRTHLRRYYWSNTRLLGDGFEYTGTGRELLVGFLIALAIFVPLNFTATLIGLFAGPMVGGVISTATALVVLPSLVQVVIYRARAYRLARTRYRGIRFHQTGSAWGFLATTAKWIALTILTLGILLPYLREAMHHYRVSNTHFGSLGASCASSGKALMKSWLVVWFTALVVVVIAVYLAGHLFMGAGYDAIATEGGVLLLALLSLPLLWQIYRVGEFRHFVSTTRFGELSLSSDASARTVIWITFRFLLIIGGLVLAFLLIAAQLGLILNVSGQVEGGAVPDVSGPAILFVLLVPLLFFTSYAVLAELFLRRSLWAHYAGSIALTNTGELAGIIQREGESGGAFGDSFDTGLDFAG